MEITSQTCLHPKALSLLFAHQDPVQHVFKDVLGLYDINHIALSFVNHQQELLSLSSTPALEFNLFNSALWHFDQTYQSHWYQQGALSSWLALYDPHHKEALFALKQLKYNYVTGLSYATKTEAGYVIYSLASQQREALSSHEPAALNKIGEYCHQKLLPFIQKTSGYFSANSV